MASLALLYNVLSKRGGRRRGGEEGVREEKKEMFAKVYQVQINSMVAKWGHSHTYVPLQLLGLAHTVGISSIFAWLMNNVGSYKTDKYHEVVPEVSAQSKHLFLGNSSFVLILVLLLFFWARTIQHCPILVRTSIYYRQQGLNKCPCSMFYSGQCLGSFPRTVLHLGTAGCQDLSVFANHTLAGQEKQGSCILLSGLNPGLCSWLVTLDEFLTLLYLSFYKVRTTVRIISGCFQA